MVIEDEITVMMNSLVQDDRIQELLFPAHIGGRWKRFVLAHSVSKWQGSHFSASKGKVSGFSRPR
jgi:hypothetical protein